MLSFPWNDLRTMPLYKIFHFFIIINQIERLWLKYWLESSVGHISRLRAISLAFHYYRNNLTIKEIAIGNTNKAYRNHHEAKIQKAIENLIEQLNCLQNMKIKTSPLNTLVYNFSYNSKYFFAVFLTLYKDNTRW